MASSAGAAAAATAAGAARKVAAIAVLFVLLVLSISGRLAAAGLSALPVPVPPAGPIGQVGGCIQNCAEVAKTCSSFCQGLSPSDVPTSKQCESLCGLQAGGQGPEAVCLECNRTACVPDCIGKKCTCDGSHASAP